MTVYDDAFFAESEADVLRSARVVAPLLLQLVQPRSVLDVGCGRGAWLSVFRDLGIDEVRGLDGEHVNRSRLLIDEPSFVAVDLARPFAIDGTFDLALCLEVVEHLQEAAGRRVVEALAAAAPVVAFSAAIPGQGGTGHVNERWPRYWEDLFASHDFARVEAIRPLVSHDVRVKWWYRQNMTLYVAEGALERSPALSRYRDEMSS